MSLPVIKHPTFTTELTSVGKIKFRNFINAEHKSLLTAIELGDSSSVFNTTLDIVDACTDNNVDASKLTEAELEFLFLKIYIRSVQNKVEGQYKCHNLVEQTPEFVEEAEDLDVSDEVEFPKQTEANDEVTDELDSESEDYELPLVECGNDFKIIIPIDAATVDYTENFNESKVVKVSDDAELHLRLPSASEKHELSEMEEDEDVDIRVIFSYFDYTISLAENVTTKQDDITFEQFNDWFGTLSPESVEHIILFIDNEPQLGYDFKIQCPKCLNEDVIRFRGMQSFFA